MRGIGLTVLYQDNVTGRLYNFWINEHDAGHPVGCLPIMVRDFFEPAFIVDYGLKGADYVDAYFENIDWQTVELRLK